jgi:hypothetical protein
LGASVPDQALVASDQAASRLAPSGFDPSRLERAIELAARAHAGQVDKARQPYILHPLRVMMQLYDQEMRIAAVLHDVVEDSFVTLSDIEAQFGGEVADAVDALTRRAGESYDQFIERCGRNRIARLVKVADLQDNMNLSRLPIVSERDLARHDKYLRAKHRLFAIAMEARRGGNEVPSRSDDSAGPKDIAQ